MEGSSSFFVVYSDSILLDLGEGGREVERLPLIQATVFSYVFWLEQGDAGYML